MEAARKRTEKEDAIRKQVGFHHSVLKEKEMETEQKRIESEDVTEDQEESGLTVLKEKKLNAERRKNEKIASEAKLEFKEHFSSQRV